MPRRPPGWRPPAPGSRLSTQGNTGVNSAGAREAANNFLLDGVDNNDLFLNRLVINPSLDAIQEFAAHPEHLRRGIRPQRRRAGQHGGEVRHQRRARYRPTSSSATRRSTRATCSTPDDSPNPALQRHQFGGTLGGPIRSNKVVLLRQRRRHQRPTRPTRGWRTFRPPPSAPATSAQRGIVIHDPFTGQPFPGERDPGRSPERRRRGGGEPLSAARIAPAPHANFVSSPVADRDAVQFTVKTDFAAVARQSAERPLQLQPRQRGPAVSGAGQQPAGLRHLGARRGAQPGGRPDASRCHRGW